MHFIYIFEIIDRDIEYYMSTRIHPRNVIPTLEYVDPVLDELAHILGMYINCLPL